jgi:membrane protein implicated in regulation of membrane protease activity
MRRLGTTLLILGIGSFILPAIGIQFKIMYIFGDATPIVAIGFAIVGLVLIIVGKSDDEIRNKKADKLKSEIQKLEPYINELIKGVSESNGKQDLENLIEDVRYKAGVSRDAVVYMLKKIGEYVLEEQKKQTAGS